MLAAIALGLLVGCDDDEPAGRQNGDRHVSEAFAGAVNADPQTLVAVEFGGVVGRGGVVTVFVCDGTDLWQFFEGPVAADQAELTSQEGSTDGTAIANLRLHDDHVQGEITLGDGTLLSFDITTARGPDGFYLVAIDSDGGLSGASRVGGTLLGTVTGDHIIETIVGPDGHELTGEGTVRNFVPEEAPQLGGLRVAEYDRRAVGISARRGTLGFVGKEIEFIGEGIEI